MATGRLPDPNTAPVTAKGDLYTYSTVPAKLAVGNNGETLVADSSATTGLRWTATPSASNPILNSAFDIWQRGTSFVNPTNNSYVADRWQQSNPANSTITRQTTGDTTNLPNIQYCIRVQRNSGATTTGTLYLGSAQEIENSIPFAGKTVTFSFYARKGANFSATSDRLTLKAFTGTSTTQQNGFTATYTGSVTAINEDYTLTSTWQRFTKTITFNSDITQFALWFQYVTTGTAGAADYYELTGVQIDIGSVALPFRRAMNTLAGELAACQRYYYKLGANSISGTSLGAVGAWYSSTRAQLLTNHPVTMRGTPSVSLSGAGIYQANGSRASVTAYQNNAYSSTGLNIDVTSSGGVAGNGTALVDFSSGAGYLEVSAEL